MPAPPPPPAGMLGVEDCPVGGPYHDGDSDGNSDWCEGATAGLPSGDLKLARIGAGRIWLKPTLAHRVGGSWPSGVARVTFRLIGAARGARSRPARAALGHR